MLTYPGKILSIDPGSVHVGLAAWDDVYKWSMEVTPDNLIDVLRTFRPKTIVIESFKIYGAKYQRFSKAPEIGLIERVKMYAEEHGVEYFEQDAPLRKIGFASPYFRQHKEDHEIPRSDHAKAALAHLIYYMFLGKGDRDK